MMVEEAGLKCRDIQIDIHVPKTCNNIGCIFHVSNSQRLKVDVSVVATLASSLIAHGKHNNDFSDDLPIRPVAKDMVKIRTYHP